MVSPNGARKDEAGRLSPGDYVFLCCLLDGALTAYDIKKTIGTAIGYFWTAGRSQIYQQAGRLTRWGYVRQKVVDDKRPKNLLSLTPRGRRAALEWLRTPPRHDHQIYSETFVKLRFADPEDLEVVAAILLDYRAQCEDWLTALDGFRREQQGRPFQAITVDAMVCSYHALIDWVDRSLASFDEDDVARLRSSRPRSADGRASATSDGSERGDGGVLAPGDYVFLCCLLAGPVTAYDIKKASTTMGHFWTAGHSQIYQQAGRLTRWGYVRQKVVDDKRSKKLLSLTPRGRSAVHRWLRTPPRDDYQIYAETFVKLHFARPEDLDVVAAILFDYRARCEADLAVFEEAGEGAEGYQMQGMLTDAMISVYRALVMWVDRSLVALRDDDQAAMSTGS